MPRVNYETIHVDRDFQARLTTSRSLGFSVSRNSSASRWRAENMRVVAVLRRAELHTHIVEGDCVPE